MRFYEFEAKRLLGKHGIPVPKNALAQTAAEAERLAGELGSPVALKAQVLSHKSAALRSADSPTQARQAAEQLLRLDDGGRAPKGVLLEPRPTAAQEYSLAITYDGIAKLPVMIASTMAGNLDEIADQHPERVVRRHFSALFPHSEYRAKELVSALGVASADLPRLTSIVSRLAELFLKYDLTQVEISSLARLADGNFVALDCHMDMEVEGRRRQKAILDELGIPPGDSRAPREQTAFEIEAAKIDAEDPRGVAGPVVEFDGNIGLVIGAGGGSLTTFDAVKKHGGKPANYAALGGNPSVKKAQRLTKLVLSKPGVEKIAVISNVLSNTRADLVARGVIKGVLELGFNPAEKITIFRIPGAWEADGVKILRKYGVEFCDRTVSISEAARRAVEKMRAAGR
ncbi:MAG: acetate--CoA ligase family protein [Deltaproteobacteria bacterium]|nr:acetate--CoA ligase family protein [Deltaproteobacteria bacterium]